MATKGLLLWCASVLLFSSIVVADSVVGCGGFVEVSPELSSFKPKKLDLQFIKIELYSMEGVLKDTTDCAPNGYYFFVLDSKATFRIEIKGPEGWTFAPSSVVVEDGKCLQGKDINFQLTGFTLSGKVVSSALGGNLGDCDPEVGPEGVTVQLRGKKSNVPARATITSRQGYYSFHNIMPGEYLVTATHSSWNFSKAVVSVQLEWGNVVVRDNLVVSGYNIAGYVATSNDEPVAGVHFMLFASQTSSESFNCQQIDLELPEEHEMGKPLCVVRSDEVGRFVFGNVPCGVYQIVPFYRNVHTTFDVAPSRQNVGVGQGDVSLKETFKVIGFSVIGRVVDALGDGIPDVTIIVDGQERAITDFQGYYTLEKIPVSSITHDIEASKDHLFFDSLVQHRLTPSNPRLPDIHVTSYHLCGRIIIEQRPPDVHPTTHREIVLVPQASKREERRSAEPSGNYCFEVYPGEYTISPVVSQEEQKAGLLFAPVALVVVIANSPRLDVNFKQVLVTLSGVVRCIDSPCDASISVALSARDRTARVTTGLGIGITPMGKEPASARNEDYYVFRDLFPGTYEIQVSREAWCWENASYVLDIKGKTDAVLETPEGDKQQQYTAPDFVQSGFILTTLASHDISLILDLENSPQDQKLFALTKGTNRFCLKKPGFYTLSPRSCYRFEQESYKYDTSAPHVVDLIITHYSINGSIEVSLPNPPKSLYLTVRYLSDPTLHEERVSANLVSSSEGRASYSWRVWAAVMDVLEVTPQPHHPLLFYPSARQITLTSAECPPPIPPFLGRIGKYIIGQISPGLANVKVEVINSTSGEVVKRVETLANGTYIAGPLYDDVFYRVKAEKEGYELTAVGELDFTARKLAMVRASVGVHSPDGQSLSLPGVLLSLSGEGYRNNNATNEEGQFTFSALSAGVYFLRPLLKEYLFEPTSLSVEVAEGEEKQVSFTARRVAFSIYGSVRSLNGEGEKWVVVEAVGPHGEREETQTDTHGSFRLRGLIPGREYAIFVKLQPDRIERASPEQYHVVMPQAEIQDIRFVVFRRPPKVDLTGEVFAEPPSLLQSLWVELYSAGGNGKVLGVRRVGPAGFFDFGAVGRENEEYLLRVATSLSRQAYSFNHTERPVLLASPSVHVNLSFSASHHHTDKDAAQPPFAALAIALVALAAAVYYKTNAS